MDRFVFLLSKIACSNAYPNDQSSRKKVIVITLKTIRKELKSSFRRNTNQARRPYAKPGPGISTLFFPILVHLKTTLNILQ